MGLHFGHPLPWSIKNFVTMIAAPRRARVRDLALREVHKIDFSSGIFSVIGPWPRVGGESAPSLDIPKVKSRCRARP